MSLIELHAELETYFINNWGSTPIQIDGSNFSNEGLAEYIHIRYINDDNECLMGRETAYGTLQVYCYHRVKNQSIILSDEIKEFIGDTSLPQGIYVHSGIQAFTHELDNNYWVSLIQFKVEQN